MSGEMLTTIDNPFNPHTQYDEWYAWDHDAGYHTPSYISRIIATSDELSNSDQDLCYDLAMDEILKENVLGVYRKVSRETPVYETPPQENEEVSV